MATGTSLTLPMHLRRDCPDGSDEDPVLCVSGIPLTLLPTSGVAHDKSVVLWGFSECQIQNSIQNPGSEKDNSESIPHL